MTPAPDPDRMTMSTREEYVDVADVPNVPDNIGPGVAPGGVVTRVWAVNPEEELSRRVLPHVGDDTLKRDYGRQDSDIAYTWALENPGRTVYVGVWDGDTGDLMGGLEVGLDPGPLADLVADAARGMN